MTTYNAFVSYLADRQTDRQTVQTHRVSQYINSFTAITLCKYIYLFDLLACSTKGAHVKSEKYFVTQDTCVDLQSARIQVANTLHCLTPVGDVKYSSALTFIDS